MKTQQKIIIGLMGLALLIGPGTVRDANAKLRGKIALRTPGINIRIGGPDYRYHTRYKRKPMFVRNHRMMVVSVRDREVARRLSGYTGVRTRELIQLRRFGYRWNEIARWLSLPRHTVRAAMHHRTWKRFLREEQLCRGGHRNGKRGDRVTRITNVYEDRYGDY